MGEKVRTIYYMKKDNIMTEIDLYPKGIVKFKNYTSNPLESAFGISESPVRLNDLEEFLADRCFPESRGDGATLRKYLGVDYHDPLSIVEKTHGIMFDDVYWVKFEGEESLSYAEARKQVGL